MPTQPQHGIMLSSLPASSSNSQHIHDVPYIGVEKLAVHSSNETSDDEDMKIVLQGILQEVKSAEQQIKAVKESSQRALDEFTNRDQNRFESRRGTCL